MADVNPGVFQAPSNKKRAKLIFGVMLAMLVVGLVFWNYTTFGGGIWSADRDSPDCIKVQATVTEVYAKSGDVKKKNERYFVTFEYLADGETYSDDEQITYDIFHRLHLGGPIEICYMKDHPGRSAVMGNNLNAQQVFYVILIDFIFVVIVWLVIRAMWMRRKKAATAA